MKEQKKMKKKVKKRKVVKIKDKFQVKNKENSRKNQIHQAATDQALKIRKKSKSK